jgi:hypothetical protein
MPNNWPTLFLLYPSSLPFPLLFLFVSISTLYLLLSIERDRKEERKFIVNTLPPLPGYLNIYIYIQVLYPRAHQLIPPSFNPLPLLQKWPLKMTFLLPTLLLAWMILIRELQLQILMVHTECI